MDTNTLERISLTDFQSLANIDVELGRFTAVIGPSNTGKTALVRAIKALARNAPAPGLVREGKAKFVAEATFSDGQTVALTKGKSVSEFSLNDKTWAKSGGSSAPDEIEAFWALPDFCITSQHDAPFLLAEPASAVAKTLGELTNAAMLMDAVREANKRRTDALADEKARSREAQECRDELATHRGISARINALEDAKALLRAAQEVDKRYTALYDLIAARKIKTGQLAELKQSRASTPDVSAAVVIAEGFVKRLAALEKLTGLASAKERLITQAAEQAVSATLARSQIEAEIHNLLSEAGICPLCHQGVV